QSTIAITGEFISNRLTAQISLIVQVAAVATENGEGIIFTRSRPDNIHSSCRIAAMVENAHHVAINVRALHMRPGSRGIFALLVFRKTRQSLEFPRAVQKRNRGIGPASVAPGSSGHIFLTEPAGENHIREAR